MRTVLTIGFLVVVGMLGCSDEVENGSGGGGAASSSTVPTTGVSGSGPDLGGSGGTTGSGGTGGVGGVGAAPGCVTTDGPVLAMDKIWVGDTDWNDVKSASAWKQFGLDIDAKISTDVSVDLCQPSSGGKKTAVYPDGNGGIDNSWGKNIVPIMSALAADYSAQLNQSIADGEFTFMLAFSGLGNEADKPAFTTRLYDGSPLGHPAKLDGTDCWPVVRELLDDPLDIESSKTIFPASTLTGNVWDSSGVGAVTLVMNAGGFPLTLVVHEARLTATLDPDHAGATLGQLGGVLDTEELVAEFKKAAGSFDPSLCEGTTIESIANQLRQASDILKDGTQDPAKICDGISIGIGFHMEAVQLGGVAPAAPPVDDPCAM